MRLFAKSTYLMFQQCVQRPQVCDIIYIPLLLPQERISGLLFTLSAADHAICVVQQTAYRHLWFAISIGLCWA